MPSVSSLLVIAWFELLRWARRCLLGAQCCGLVNCLVYSFGSLPRPALEPIATQHDLPSSILKALNLPSRVMSLTGSSCIWLDILLGVFIQSCYRKRECTSRIERRE